MYIGTFGDKKPFIVKLGEFLDRFERKKSSLMVHPAHATDRIVNQLNSADVVLWCNTQMQKAGYAAAYIAKHIITD